MRGALFQTGDFTLASGRKSAWKIECDSLSADDWEGLAAIAVEILPPFGGVVGVPRGGLLFAAALGAHATPGCRTLLVAEDVVTTGGSVERYLKANPPQPGHWDRVVGVAAFARGPCPAWVVPLFALTLSRRDDVADSKKQPAQSGQQNPPNVAGGPADDTSVRALADKAKEFAADVMSGNFFDAIQPAKSLISVGLDLLGLPNIFGAGAEGEDDAAALDEAQQALEGCKAKAEGPQPKGAAGADPKGIDPATILLIIQLVTSLIDAIRKRRSGQ